MNRLPVCKFVAETLNVMWETPYGEFYTYQRVASLIDRACAADPDVENDYYRLGVPPMCVLDPDDGQKYYEQDKMFHNIARAILDAQKGENNE